jgi:hypothetical protein
MPRCPPEAFLPNAEKEILRFRVSILGFRGEHARSIISRKRLETLFIESDHLKEAEGIPPVAARGLGSNALAFAGRCSQLNASSGDHCVPFVQVKEE